MFDGVVGALRKNQGRRQYIILYLWIVYDHNHTSQASSAEVANVVQIKYKAQNQPSSTKLFLYRMKIKYAMGAGSNIFCVSRGLTLIQI